jgi:hypothetical protein
MKFRRNNPAPEPAPAPLAAAVDALQADVKAGREEAVTMAKRMDELQTQLAELPGAFEKAALREMFEFVRANGEQVEEARERAILAAGLSTPYPLMPPRREATPDAR